MGFKAELGLKTGGRPQHKQTKFVAYLTAQKPDNYPVRLPPIVPSVAVPVTSFFIFVFKANPCLWGQGQGGLAGAAKTSYFEFVSCSHFMSHDQSSLRVF